ncbi:MAG: metalloregulator ArsR/SmtB family transcription factor [Colwellia sp.]|nr:metalloregulator ArsR/SmtB family transcription factor [Colwellia sp.]
MDSDKTEALDKVFMALADKTRREMVHRLAKANELSINELTKGLDMSLAAASKHIKVLEKAKLITRRIEGRVHNIRLAPEKFGVALDWISIYRNFWQSRMNLLASSLNEDNKNV